MLFRSEKVTAMIGRVTPAFFSSVQSDAAELRRYLLLVTEGLSVITFPMCIGIALVAEDLVHVALGPAWETAVLPLRWLAIFSAFRSVQPLFPQVMSAVGEARANMKNAVLTVCVLPIGFYVATRWGIVGVARAWTVLAPLLFLPLYHAVRRKVQFSTRQYIGALWPAASGCAVMALVVEPINRVGLGSTHPMVALVAKVIIGVLAYAGAMLIFHRQRVAKLRVILSTIRSGRVPSPEDAPPEAAVASPLPTSNSIEVAVK